MTNADSGRRAFSWGAAAVVIAIVLAGFAHGGCKRGGSGSQGNQGVYLVALYLSGDPVSIQIGTSTTLTATGQYSDGSLLPEAVSWSIVPAAFATIDSNGLLSGVSVGLAYLTATANSNSTVRKTALVNVTSAPPGPPTITTQTLPNAQQGLLYTQQLFTINGQSPMTWSLKAGTLPAGIVLNAGTGVITGTCGVLGSSTFTVMVTDAVGATDDQELILTVDPFTGTTS